MKKTILYLSLLFLIADIQAQNPICSLSNTNWLVNSGANRPVQPNWLTTNNAEFQNSVVSASQGSQLNWINTNRFNNQLNANNLIWKNGIPLKTSVYFKNVINLPCADKIDSVTLILAADDFIDSVWFNGNFVSTGPPEINGLSGWQHVLRLTFANPSPLYPNNYLVIRAKDNGGQVAWLAARVCIYYKPTPKFSNISTNILDSACNGDTLTLKANPYDTSYRYSWSNGQTTNEIKVTSSGTYTVIITNANGCKDTSSKKIIFKECCTSPCQWNIDGNNNINKSHYLGTRNNAALIFKTNALERMRITQSGIVGIGTNDPSWNFNTTIDNRDYSSSNGWRNGLHVIAIQPNFTHGYGQIISSNTQGCTKALAIQGNGTDNAIVWANGMSWFKNRMRIGGGGAGTLNLCDNSSSGNMFEVFGNLTANNLFQASDSRYKKDIKSIDKMEDKVLKLNPVTYQYRVSEFKEKNFDKSLSIGFLAQELQKEFPELVKQEVDGYFTVNYIGLIPVLTKTIQEQNTSIKAVKSENQSLKSEVEMLKERLATIEKMIGVKNEGLNQIKDELFDPIPNPTSGATEIFYQLSQEYSNAYITIMGLDGKVIESYKLSAQKGKSSIKTDLSKLASGIYLYSLVAGERVIDSKRLQVNK